MMNKYKDQLNLQIGSLNFANGILL